MLITLVSGFVAGIAGGMGIGGGAILIPALTLLSGIEQHSAQSTNLIFFIPTAIVALIIHIKNKNIDIKKATVLILSGIAGSFGGSAVANFMEGNALRKMFAVFLIIFGLIELFKKKEN